MLACSPRVRRCTCSSPMRGPGGGGGGGVARGMSSPHPCTYFFSILRLKIFTDVFLFCVYRAPLIHLNPQAFFNRARAYIGRIAGRPVSFCGISPRDRAGSSTGQRRASAGLLAGGNGTKIPRPCLHFFSNLHFQTYFLFCVCHGPLLLKSLQVSSF